jgi:PAS domain S-box-containing protein
VEKLDEKTANLLVKSKLLDTGGEEAYDRFTKLAVILLNTPVSLITLIDKDRQYFKSFYGLPEPWASRRQTPLSHSICQYVVSSRKPLIVTDARREEQLKDNLSITDFGVIAYLGFPLEVENQTLGSFCVIDTKPHPWSEREIGIVRELAHFVAAEIALSLAMIERQRVTEQLQISEKRFSTLANHAPIMIWQTDIHGNVIFANETWCKFTGLVEPEDIGPRWLKLVHPDDRERAFKFWTEMFTARLPYHIELRLYRSDGVYRDVIVNGSKYISPDGIFLGYIGTLLDITEQKELDRQKEIFMSMAAHELKSPLTAVQGNVQLAQRRLHNFLSNAHRLNTEQEDELSHVVDLLTRGLKNLQTQTRLINDLLDVSRVQAEKLEFQLAECALVALVQQTVQDQQTANPQRSVTFEQPEGEPVLVLADRERTRQVLINYLANAFKYSPPEQPVEIGISTNAAYARVWVRDHGYGLTLEQQTHIWESFYQTQESSTTYTQKTPGLGLGLHICQVLISGQQGQVGVDSAPGEGSTFWFTLPLLHRKCISFSEDA